MHTRTYIIIICVYPLMCICILLNRNRARDSMQPRCSMASDNLFCLMLLIAFRRVTLYSKDLSVLMPHRVIFYTRVCRQHVSNFRL